MVQRLPVALVQVKKANTSELDCMLLSCHVRVSE